MLAAAPPSHDGNWAPTIALDVYCASLKGKPAQVLDGLTRDSLVFLGWPQA